tara:strand:- start:480 stop:1268 length:789 start_codon:yes stop_codon:yes gene_type:complete
MKRVLVIGDSCEDIYNYGSCDRLAPEGPVPVFYTEETVTHPGMAKNVINNLTSLGVDCTIVTQDRIITKTRFIEAASNHLFIRVDSDSPKKSSTRVFKSKIQKGYLSEFDAIIVSDYDKGFLTKQTLETIASNHPLTFLDTKKVLGEWAFGFTFIKINSNEYENLRHFNPLLFSEEKSRDSLYKSLIVTKGPMGCYYKKERYRVSKVEIRDFSGAGDTFLAGLVCKYLEKEDIKISIEFANLCATQVVQKRGVSCVTIPVQS